MALRDAFVWTDREVELLLNTVFEYKSVWMLNGIVSRL